MYLIPVTLLVSFAIAGCASMNQGQGFLRQDCSKLDIATFAEGFVCSQMGSTSADPAQAERNVSICHHSMLSAYHGAMATCIGLTDNPAPVPPDESE